MACDKKPFSKISDCFNSFSLLYGDKIEGQKERYENAFIKFKKVFNENSCFVASSSGRTEIVGNHTDHNGGKVISSAISLDTLAMFLPRDDGKIVVVSDGYKDMELDVFGDTFCYKGTSLALIKGVVEGVKKAGFNVGGFNAYCTSNVLGGAGISSSAAFELLIAEIINFLYNDGKIDNELKAKIAQFSEREYFGKPCGLLDQTAISFGGIKKLDFKNPEKIEVTNVECNIKDFTFVLINTGGSHENLTDEYASIPQEMRQVANSYSANRLIEITPEQFYKGLPERMNELCDRAVMRAVHFFEENERVELAVNALQNNNFNDFVRAINESGISSNCNLQNCFVPTEKCRAIPKAVALAKVFVGDGAVRVHGGGFAGCVLCVVKNDKIEDFVSNLSTLYGKENVIELKVRSCGTIVL